MIYLLLSAAFTAVAAIVAAVALVVAGRREPSRSVTRGMRAVLRRWAVALAIAAGALFILTAVFDNIMINLEFMVYSDAHTSGLAVGLAPLEDFTYPLAGLLLLPALWVLFARRAPKSDHE